MLTTNKSLEYWTAEAQRLKNKRGSRGNRDIVIYLREQNPEMTLQEIGLHVGISKQRVGQILVSENLETRSTGKIPIPMPNCKHCGTPLPTRQRTYCTSKCQYPNGRTITRCHYCNKEINFMTAVYKARNSRAKYVHCSQKCRDASRRGQTNERYKHND